MTMIRRWWKGEERLVIVYWGSLAILAAIKLVDLGVERMPDPETVAELGFLWVVGIAQLGAYAFIVVSVWACAFNVKHRLWGYLARIQVAMGAVGSIGLLLKSLQ